MIKRNNFSLSCLIFLLPLWACNISGTITEDGLGLEGVTVALGGSEDRKTITNSKGHFIFTDVAAGHYSITPSLMNYEFSPESLNVEKTIQYEDIKGIDFEATNLCNESVEENTNYVPCGIQNEITEPSDLLSENGELNQTGWARQPLLNFNPENLRTGWERGKWWDFYGVVNEEFNLTFFAADLGYMTLITLSFSDFQTGEVSATGTVYVLTKGEFGLSNSSMEGNLIIEDWLAGNISIERHPDHHLLSFDSHLFSPDPLIINRLKGDVRLETDPSKDSMVVATAYKEDPYLFYYNHKFNLLPATGSITYGGKTYELTPENTYGQFDWGRGVWPYETHWYWGTGAGIVDGHEVWFNIGYGFGDLSTHTENMIFYDGKCHKIDQVAFHVQEKRSGRPWTFTSNDNRLELTLEPLADQSQDFDVGFAKIDSNNIAGLYSGYLILDDGTKIEIENMHGHAEDIRYLW